MKTGVARHTTFQLFRLALFIAYAGLALPGTARAVQWRELAQTSRHSVALEMSSLRMNETGRLTVWLRFTPRGELQRREAAREYENRNYRLHLEYYELDCGEKSAVLKLIDILGANGKRLVRLPGGGLPDAVIPDSILDRAAQRVCPVVEEVAASDDDDTPDAIEQATADAAGSPLMTEENRQRIENALGRTKQNPDVIGSWIELGNAYYDAALPKEAVEAYDRALRLNPNDTNVLNDQGVMLRQQGDTTRALKNFEKSLALDPGNLESLYTMGYIYAIDLNRIDKALEVWKRYLAQDSTSETAEQVRTFVKQFEQGPVSR